MKQAILFDVDGTLVDSNDLHAQAWVEAFEHFGFRIDPALVRAQIGKGGDNLIPSLLAEDQVREWQPRIDRYRSDLFRRHYLPKVRPFPGVRSLFDRLRRDGIGIVLATSAKKEELDHHIALIGVADLIDGATSKDDVDHSKPCPDIFEAALDKTEAARDRIRVVGDSPWDVEAASKAGLRAIGLLHGGFEAALLRQAGAAALYDDLEALSANYPEWLDK